MQRRPACSLEWMYLAATNKLMREHFYGLVESLVRSLSAAEHLHASLDGETSDFIRFNHSRVRQAGQIKQYTLQLTLVRDRKHCHGSCDLSGNAADDEAAIKLLLADLRRMLPNCPDDPYLNYSTQVQSSGDTGFHTLPTSDRIARLICESATDLDLVGIYAAGDIVRGYANSYGQRNWHGRSIFNFDWSCHLPANRATKSHYAGSDWQTDQFTAELQRQRRALEILQLSPKTLAPGAYRVYLAPTALAELLGLLNWGGFSLRELRTHQSPLLKLAAGNRMLNPMVSLYDNRGDGLVPLFTEEGFVIPARVDLIINGRAGEALVDARSAREYDKPVNAASESPQALEMAAGSLAEKDILQALDTGIYINHLWYGNFSDINNCRITGMTRYACFWVENGRIKAPLHVMRFDDSIFRLLGEQLLAVTRERRFLHDPDTYEQRSLDSMHLPGILCNELRLTL